MTLLVNCLVEDPDRRIMVKSVLASFRMEGLEPDAETMSLLQQYAAGALSLDRLGSAIERHVAEMKFARVDEGAA